MISISFLIAIASQSLSSYETYKYGVINNDELINIYIPARLAYNFAKKEAKEGNDKIESKEKSISEQFQQIKKNIKKLSKNDIYTHILLLEAQKQDLISFKKHHHNKIDALTMEIKKHLKKRVYNATKKLLLKRKLNIIFFAKSLLAYPRSHNITSELIPYLDRSHIKIKHTSNYNQLKNQ